jgi:hypothetical protein
MTSFHLTAGLAGLAICISAGVGVAHAQAPGAGKPGPELSPAQQEARQKRALEKQKLDECNKQAVEQKILVRDRTKFLIDCVGK